MRASLNVFLINGFYGFYGEITGIISHDSNMKFTFPAERLGNSIM